VIKADESTLPFSCPAKGVGLLLGWIGLTVLRTRATSGRRRNRTTARILPYMGNLAEDTEVWGESGRYTARLSKDWEIWGPNGGYLAAVALRAAGRHSELQRPASLSCHFLSVAAFEEVDITVTTLRRAKRAESLRVSVAQDGQPIIEAVAWVVSDSDGLAHDFATMPDVAPPEELKSVQELLPPDTPPPPFAFWMNFEERPLHWVENWEERVAGDPVVQAWYRYVPQATFDDPFVDAGRYAILLDTMSWPSATRAHPPGTPWMAPTLDVNIQFHRSDPSSEWLLADGVAPIAEDGLIAFRSHIWSRPGHLLATGTGQLLCRPFRG
jgi:acyl-CoA thioesterase II